LIEPIFNQTKTGNNGFLGQILVFCHAKVPQSLFYFQKNCKKELYIHNQHTLFHHSIKKRNEKLKKKQFSTTWGVPPT
jgi:hypothetical protein